jgi:hypothetical protein
MQFIALRYGNMTDEQIAATANETGIILTAYMDSHPARDFTEDYIARNLFTRWEQHCAELRARSWTDDMLADHVHCPNY